MTIRTARPNLSLNTTQNQTKFLGQPLQAQLKSVPAQLQFSSGNNLDDAFNNQSDQPSENRNSRKSYIAAGMSVLGGVLSLLTVIVFSPKTHSPQIAQPPAPAAVAEVANPNQDTNLAEQATITLPSWNAAFADTGSINFIDLQRYLSDFDNGSGAYDYEALTRAANSTNNPVTRVILNRLALMARTFDRSVTTADIEQLGRISNQDIFIQAHDVLRLPEILRWGAFPVSDGRVSYVELLRDLFYFNSDANNAISLTFNPLQIRNAANNISTYASATPYQQALIRLADWSEWKGQPITPAILESMAQSLGDGLFFSPAHILDYVP